MPTPLNLPEPSTAQLDPAPLQLVVCQVRHEEKLDVADPNKILAIQDDLGEFPQLEPQTGGIEVVAGPAGMEPVRSSFEQRGWRLQTSDGAWTVSLMPEFFALECTGYTSWSDFRRRLSALTESVHKRLERSLVRRLGLRYIDRLNEPHAAELRDWQGYVNERLLGPILDERFGDSINALQQVVQMEGPGGLQVLLRHGAEQKPEGGWSYLLDTDCFATASKRFTPDGVLADATQLHKLSLQVFQAAVTESLLERLREGREVSA